MSNIKSYRNYLTEWHSHKLCRNQTLRRLVHLLKILIYSNDRVVLSYAETLNVLAKVNSLPNWILILPIYLS